MDIDERLDRIEAALGRLEVLIREVIDEAAAAAA